MPLPPKEEAKLHVILNAVKNPTEELTGIYFSLWSWDISLTLNMTDFFICLCEGSEATKQTPGRVEVYGVYSPYFFRGIAAALRASQ